MRSFATCAFMASVSLFNYVRGDILCDADHHCPEETPCCNQFSGCGTGFQCLGGCDPRFSFNLSACMPQPRMSSFQDSFKDISNIIPQYNFLGNITETDWVYDGHISSYEDALMLQMPVNSNTLVSSTKYFLYGKLGATMKTSHGGGVVTALITYSNVKDEIDYEMVGSNLTYPQNNYYFQGTLDWTHSNSSLTSDTFENWHYYEIDWKEDKIVWSVDGVPVRTLTKDSTFNSTSKRYEYPSTPARVQLSLWPGGNADQAPGTREWAGGLINWDSDDIKKYGYYYALVKNLSVEVYDLPSFLTKDVKNVTNLNAFLYTSPDGFETDVALTNQKWWLGSQNATGLNPQNDDDDKSSSSSSMSSSASASSSSGSGSSKASKTSETSETSKTSKTTVTTKTSTTENATETSTTSTKGDTGGFVQNVKATDSASTRKTASSGATSGSANGIVAILAATFAMASAVFFASF